MFEWVKFNLRKQKLVDGFIIVLYCLAEYCGYGERHDEMIRDQPVVGLCDVGTFGTYGTRALATKDTRLPLTCLP